MSMKQEILDYIARPGYRAIKAKSLAKKLGITKKKMPQFEQTLNDAVEAGLVRMSDNGRVQAKNPPGSYLGVLKRISSGSAFVILHEPKPPEIDGDVFVDQHDLKDAQTGDEVLIKLLQRHRRNGQSCGYVVDVVERATNVFVGTYFEEDDAGWVQIDGKDFSDPVWVGDPGAKGAQEGDKVVIEMLRFPSSGQVGEAVLTKVLGARGEPGVETQLIIHEYGIPDEFSDEVLEEARIEAENFEETVLDDREDLTDLTILTIDPADARDFDDAISLSRSSGGWTLGVHIADVSHFVQSGSVLDREAQTRGTSVYLPTKVIPMLPEVISNGLASLQENRVRYAMSAFIDYSPEGILTGTRFSRSAIKVNKRFAYEEVMPIVKSTDENEFNHVPANIRKQLCDMHELAMMLRARRFKKGALELDMPEVRLDLDKDGNVSGAHEHPHDESHQIIEEFMLAANIAVATELNDRNIDFLRRVHANPTPTKLNELAEFAKLLGYPIEKPQSRKDLQGLLHRVKGQPEERAINYTFLRSLKQAEYSPMNVGHYALAEDHYCHFTSPIRRYPDLMIHRLIAGIVTGNKTERGTSGDELIRLGHQCSATERRAEKAERELTKIKLLSYMEERIGEQLEAVITGVDRFGFFARGVEVPAEGLVHVSTIPGFYEFDRSEMALVAKNGDMFRLGDHIVVAVAHVDVDRRELNYNFVERKGAAQKRKKSSKNSKRDSKDKKYPKASNRRGRGRNDKGKGKGQGKRRR